MNLSTLKSALLVILTAAASFAAVEGGLLFRELRLKDSLLFEQNLKIVGGAATDIERIARSWKQQSDTEAQLSTSAIRRMNQDLTTFGSLLVTANGLLSTQNSSLSTLETRTGTLIDSAQNTITKTGPVLENLESTTASASIAAKTFSDQAVTLMPHIGSIVSNLDLTSHDTQVFVGNLDTESDLLVGATRKALAPQSRKMTILKALGGNAVTIMEAVYYLSHGG